MNGIKGKLWAKLLAMILFVITCLTTAGSAVATAVLISADAYFDNGQSVLKDRMSDILGAKMADVQNAIRRNIVGTPDENVYLYIGESSDPFSAEIKDNPQLFVSQFDNIIDVIKVLSGDNFSYFENVICPDFAEEDSEQSTLNADELSNLAERLDYMYPADNTNLCVKLIDADTGECLYNNASFSKTSDKASKTISIYKYGKTFAFFGIFSTEDEAKRFATDLENSSDKYVFNGWSVSMIPEEAYESMTLPSGYRYCLSGLMNEIVEHDIIAELSISSELVAKDDIYIRMQKLNILVLNKYFILVVLALSFILCITSFIFVMCSAGYSDRFEGIHLTLFDKLPLEFHIGIGICAVALVFTMIDSLCWSVNVNIMMIVIFSLCIIAVTALVLIVLMYTIAARCKAGALLKYTVTFGSIFFVFRLIRRMFNFFNYVFSNLSCSIKIICLFVAMVIYNIICFASLNSGIGVLMWLVGCVALGVAMVLFAIGLDRIKQGCKMICSGKTDTKVDETHMPRSLRSLAGDVNSIGNGIQLAVDERMKSERMKTELITNVSHDLKTPLTSIVNYVDILSREDIKPDSAKEYVGVLVRQSQRMKKLIDDLVEVSKASSGAISVNLECIDMSLLLTQAVAEYDSRLDASRLTPVIKIPDVMAAVRIDGRLMWRVLDNLFSNICKYAQPETRVYINEEVTQDRVIVTFKNISRYALNISSEELMERFVRGDSSRHTEGSGLGLSIAKSLCNLQNVGFDLSIDGDLFKTILTVKRIKPDELNNASDISPDQSNNDVNSTNRTSVPEEKNESGSPVADNQILNETDSDNVPAGETESEVSCECAQPAADSEDLPDDENLTSSQNVEKSEEADHKTNNI